MGSLTLAEMQTEMLSAFGNRDDISEDRRIVFLNIAQMRIARLYDWNELQNSVSGTIGDAGDVTIDKFEAVPTNLRKIYSFRITDPASRTDSRKLRYTPQTQWDMQFPETEVDTAETPQFYTIWNNQFEFWRIPEKVYNYELRVLNWPTDMNKATPTQTSDLDHKDDMIISLAVSWGFLTLREMEDANRWWAIYRDMANNAVGQDVEEHEIDVRPTLSRSSLVRGDPWAEPFITHDRGSR